MQQANTVKLQTNEQGLMRNLRHTFSNTFTVITELLQNARRAGASCIRVNYDESLKKLSVVDDGEGVRDFQKMLTVAESGWNKNIRANEHPFGMGFFAALYACERVTVKSLGRQISFATGDALSFSDIHIEKSDFIGKGTEVIMESCKENILGNIEELVRGFPLPVIYNGKDLPRDHAANSSYLSTNVGLVSLNGLENGLFGDRGDLYVYLQGFLVKHESFPRFSGIVHLDSATFVARMPDRDKLVNEAEALKTIYAAGETLHKTNLRNKLTKLGEEAFIQVFYKSVKYFYPALLNELSFIPLQELTTPDAGGRIDLNGNCCNQPYSKCDEHLYRPDVEKNNIVLVDEESVTEETVSHWFLLQHSEKKIYLVGKLPEGHWANSHIKYVFEEEIKVSAVNPGKIACFSGEYVCEDVMLCDAIHLSIPSAGLETTVHNESLFGTVAGESFILVPADCKYPGVVVSQISSYTNEYDEFHEGYRESDESNLDAIVMRMRTCNLAELFADIINRECNLRSNAYTDLLGKSFTVAINKKGGAKVKLIRQKNPTVKPARKQ
jgi:hypothetical protein